MYGGSQDGLQIYSTTYYNANYVSFFAEPAYPRNEYLNEYGARCGDMEVRTERRDTDYNYSDNSTNEQQYLSFTYRKYLGVDCKTINENVATKTTIRIDEDVWSS